MTLNSTQELIDDLRHGRMVVLADAEDRENEGDLVLAAVHATGEKLAFIDDHVAVYFPQSYNFAGQVLIVPRASVTPLASQSADIMTFIVSGGISGR